MRKPLAVAAAVVFSASIAPSASALGPIDLEAGAKVGYGTNPSSASGAVNPLGVGLGARGGVSIFNLYGGINAMYYLGGSQDIPVAGAGSVSASVHSLLYGIEVGYSIKALLLTVRPQVGVGNATITTSSGGSSQSNNNLYLEPGVTALISLGLVYVGADANLLVLPGIEKDSSGSSKTDTAFTLHGQIGVRL